MLTRHSASFLHRAQSTLLDFIFPKICIACGTLDQINKYSVCKKCWESSELMKDHPHCYVCGNKTKITGLCIACEFLGSSFDDAKSAFLYNDLMKRLVRALKFADQTIFAKFAAQIIVDHFKKEIINADFIIPVPIHRIRLFKRKYNQSALIANHIPKITSIPIRFDIIKKIKYAKPQAKLCLEERRMNLQNAFAFKNTNCIKNSKIILLDDVITTGATICGCADLIRNYNPAKITALSLARSILQ